MNILAYLAVVLGLLSGSCFAYSNDCSQPELWCQDQQTAKECNVLDQCEKFVWSNKQQTVLDSAAVDFTLYYEVLCPDCRQFVSQQLGRAAHLVHDIMNLTLVPYGNAKESFNSNTNLWEFTCQHGADECWGNLLHTCVLHYYPKPEGHFPFIYCMESAKSNVNEDIHDVAAKCAKQVNLSIDEPLKCVDSKLGNDLQHELALQTGSLSPAHKYVPWVTVNGVHTEDIQNQAQDDLVKLICDTYKGSNKPIACK